MSPKLNLRAAVPTPGGRVAVESDEAAEMLRAGPASLPPGLEAGTLPWYSYLERKRYGRAGAWLPALMEFDRHRSEVVLCHGPTLGTDWAQYAKNGAEVAVVDSRPERLAKVESHFRARGLTLRTLAGKLDQIPLASGSVDVACYWGEAGADRLDAGASAELLRVLKPGGKLLAVRPLARMPWPEHDSHVAWGRRRWHRTLDGFAELSVRRRQMVRGDMPVWAKWFYLPVAERIWGRYEAARAFKPVRAVSPAMLRPVRAA